MDTGLHASLLPHRDPDASPALHRARLGFEVRSDAERSAGQAAKGVTDEGRAGLGERVGALAERAVS